MENEGWDVAKALAVKGVAAFVLKYRLNQTPADLPGFERSMQRMFSGAAVRPPQPSADDAATRLAPQIADRAPPLRWSASAPRNGISIPIELGWLDSRPVRR